MRRPLAAAVSLIALCACGPADDALPLGDGASDCAACHPVQADAFASSAHARSGASHVLRALLPEVAARWGAGARARCEQCHSPGHGSDRDVTCVSCHAAVGNHGARDGALVVDLDAPLAGPFADADAQGAHATRASDLLSSRELCASCHELTGPALFVERTATEHAIAARDLGTPRCQQCHMPALDDGPIAAGAGAERTRRDHRFAGLTPPPSDAPAERLDDYRAGVIALFEEALVIEASVAGEMLLVAVTNEGAGHSVPTGAAALRDIWVEVSFVGDGASASAPVRVIELGDRPLAGDREVALPTDADRIEHRALAAGASRHAQLIAPTGARSAVVSLRVRPYRGDLLDRLSLADTIGTIDVAMRTVPID